MEIEIRTTGGLFEGEGARAVAALRDASREAEYVVGGQAVADVHLYLNRQIKHPTPYYETQITEQVMSDNVSVNDRGVIYGPWLEGVSFRNRVTRFKGYASFRKATQATKSRVTALAEPVFARHLGGVS